MSTTPTGNPNDPAAVRAMFDRIAGRYDLMNTLMTAGLDANWRRETITAAGLAPGMRVLDLACGTGMLTRAAAAAIGPTGEAIGLDASSGMLERARRARTAVDGAPIRWEAGDAMQLPFDDAEVDAVLIGFGLRNLPDYGAALAEMARVTKPGGRVVVLEIAQPRAAVPRLLHRLWFRRIVPLLGRLTGRGAAYAYLPASLDDYPPPEAVGQLMAAAGLVDIRWRWLRGGMTTLHVGERGG
jgi:demethylmenaquinone methyltransferase / 2-methoxy-6-polyprenyl-1,4-benzoquinol methylase